MGEDETPETTEPKAAEGTTAEAAKSPAAAKPSSGMPDYIRFPLVLAALSGLAALGLAFVYGLTKARIEAAEGRKVEDAFSSILGERYGAAAQKKAYTEIRDGDGSTVAYAAQVACDNSYNSSDPVKLMVVLDADLRTVLGVRAISSKETPGFGEGISDAVAPKSLFGDGMLH